MGTGEQKIFVWCNFSDGMDDAILHGITIAVTLRKELCLLHLLDHQLHETCEIAEARLRGATSGISAHLSTIRIRYLVMDLPVVKCFNDLSELYECLVLVAHKLTVKDLLPDLQFAAFPLLFISATSDLDQLYKRIVVPVGYLKKCKDLALWASYLGRHNGAVIDLFLADEGWGADQQTASRNLYSIQRFFSKFNFPSRVIESHAPTWRLQKGLLGHALSLKSAMIIIAVSSQTTFLDALLGLTERKVIENSEELSVMCVNAHRDFYTYCN